jgi:LacI family transcriptional regulator
VDRVLHRRPGVSQTTRERVEKVIQEHDYQPDILAGHLASNRTYRFLVCMPKSVYAHEFWNFPLEGVKKALDEIRYFDIAVEYVRFDQHNRNDFIEKLGRIAPDEFDALLFAPVFGEESRQFLQRWSDAEKPFILFNSRLERCDACSYIGQDAFRSGFLGGRLISYGLEAGKDALIINLSQRKDSYQHIIKREKGFRRFFEEHGDRVRNLVTLELNTGRYEQIAEALDNYMDRYDVAGIFVTSSRVHLVARYLAERGAMYVRLVGYDLLPQSVDYLNREYIDFLISQSPMEQAYLGIMKLFSRVVLKQEVEKEILLPIDILTRENIMFYQKYNVL